MHVLSDPDRARRSSPTAGSGQGRGQRLGNHARACTPGERDRPGDQKFNDANPGHRLKAGSEHRDLGDQIWGWTHNAGVKTNAPEYLTKARIEIKRKARTVRPYPDLGDVIDPATGQHAFQIGHGGLDLRALGGGGLLFWPAALLPATIGLIEAERFQAVARFIEFLEEALEAPARLRWRRRDSRRTGPGGQSTFGYTTVPARNCTARAARRIGVPRALPPPS